MYMYVYVYIYVYIYTPKEADCMVLRSYFAQCILGLNHVYTHTYKYVYIYTYTYTYTFLYIYIYVCIYIYTYIYIISHDPQNRSSFPKETSSFGAILSFPVETWQVREPTKTIVATR